MDEVRCASCEENKGIGEPGETIHVFAFRGGAPIDSVFQLGVAHAHLVSGAKTPSLLVGVSVGAVHASATAEILQAAAQLDPDKQGDALLAREACFNRFREILFAYQDFLNSIQGGLPDAFEADAGRPLQPNPQAIHFKAEREARQRLLRTRSGLIAVINDLLAQRITVRTLARAVRSWLGFQAAGEVPEPRRKGAYLRELYYAFKTVVSAPRAVVQLALALMHACIGGAARTLRTAVEKWSGTWFRDWCCSWVRSFEGRHGEGYTAGAIIFGRRRPQIAPKVFRRGAGVLLKLGIIAAVVVWLYARLAARDGLPLFLFLVGGALVLAVCLIADILILHGDDMRQAWREASGLRWYEWVLAYYDLLQDLGNDYVIKDLFVRIFDPTYYGKIDMADVSRRAMAAVDEAPSPAADHRPRTFADFAASEVAPTQVVPVVADLRTGGLARIPEHFRIVDGLLGAVSTVPLLSPLANEDNSTFYVDATGVANEPALAALDVLSARLHPEVRKVRLFSVRSSTPLEPADAQTTYDGTVDVALAGLNLSRFRDDEMEEDLIEQYNRLLPEVCRAPERCAGEERALRCYGEESHAVRSELVRVRPPAALHISERFLQENDKAKRQTIIAQAVAEGCRATLGALHGVASEEIGCRGIVAASGGGAPGAAEVCAHCLLYRERPASRAAAAPCVVEASPPPAPAEDEAAAPKQTPDVNLLFSGGVFRGVFQIGVLNALNELGVQPNRIAGSSVGSIVAAMIARVFSRPRDERHAEIVRLASTFMTLDRLIITDRFADFVRRFTLRAAAARFSLRDADMVFRNYDLTGSEFNAVARRVIGGLEHLFYVSPFELTDLVRAMRMEDYATAYKLACKYAQEICDRGVVGFEILGAEPLALLIKQHVLDEERRDRHAHAVGLDYLENGGMSFLLTATNLTRRELRIIGGESDRDVDRAVLVESLLASSAFPGVFRPRWSREIFFEDNSLDQYIDGGVLDNLPLGAVVQHMADAVKAQKIVARPDDYRPHLILTASLEPETRILTEEEVRRVGISWPRARGRAQRLRYNKKIERFAEVQGDLRYMFDAYAGAGEPVEEDVLDIDVVVVKPRWLCSTFGFHPMLGFRRRKQAASIAHGCAATFAAIQCIAAGAQPGSDPSWPEAWGMDTAPLLPQAVDLEPATKTNGDCHFRSGVPCPFSKIARSTSAVPDEVAAEVDQIYQLCGQPATHLPQ